jgi:phosphocarrier protein HPr
MIQKTVKIVNRAGMHTRPASMIVKIAARYRSDFYILKDGYQINGKSIIGIMSLAAEFGSELVLRFDGADEEKASAEMIKYFEEGFGETLG